jgi:glycosyltransferase involved in cell wall biosynthesis
MRITVLSTFDIWPARDGGQNRLAELWSRFPSRHQIKILCYEFRNLVAERRYWLTENVEVIVPAANPSDASYFHQMAENTGLWLHDVLCASDYAFSDEFLQALHREVAASDVVVASHPYLARIGFLCAPQSTVKVYESHNVEYDIKKEYFYTRPDSMLLSNLLEDVERIERTAAESAHHVTAVSDFDRQRLIELYGLPEWHVSVVPNGATIKPMQDPDESERVIVRHQLGLTDTPVGVFLGSAYRPNVISYMRARQILDEAGFHGTLVLIGSIDQANVSEWPEVRFQERWLGFVDERVRDLLLRTADFALHLIFEGAGTNLKLFDYMLSGLPILANDFGARGVARPDWFFRVEGPGELAAVLHQIVATPEEARRRGRVAREIALEQFAWHRIAADFEHRMLSGFANG